MQQIQPVNAGTQSRPCSTCWDAHFLKMNAAWKIWQLLMRRLSTVQEPGQTYDSVQGWWTRKKDLEKGHFLGVRNGGGGASASASAPPPPPPVPPPLSSTAMVLPKTCFAWPGRLLLNISFSAAPPCQQGRPNCAEDQGLFFLKQSDPLIVWNSYKALITRNKILITRWEVSTSRT